MTLTLTARISRPSAASSAVRTALSTLAGSSKGSSLGVQQTPAAVETLNQSLFNAKLEKHLDDVANGQGALSAEVAQELFQKGQDTSALLAQTDPDALKDYSAYSTIMGYNSKARYVTSLDNTTKTLSNIPSEEEAKAATDELVKAFYPDSDAGGVKGK